MVSLNDIQKMSRGGLKLSEPLARHTSFQIGGPADYYLEPRNKDELVRLVNYFSEKDFPFIILNAASNVLVSDQGYRGAVINPVTALSRVFMEGPLVYAEAAVKIARLVDFSIRRSLKGMESLAGIPGTLSGGHILSKMEDPAHPVDVELLQDGRLVRIGRNEEKFGHNSGSSPGIMIAAWFSLPPGKKEDLIRLQREWLVKHNQTQPVNISNAVCAFKDPPGLSAATLMEEANAQGLRQGGAMVPMKKHANVIVNTGGASAHDVLTAIKKVQRIVWTKFNVILEPGMELIGFDQITLREVA